MEVYHAYPLEIWFPLPSQTARNVVLLEGNAYPLESISKQYFFSLTPSAFLIGTEKKLWLCSKKEFSEEQVKTITSEGIIVVDLLKDQ